MKNYTKCNMSNTERKWHKKLDWCIEAHLIYLTACYLRHTYPDIFESATYPFLIRLPSTCLRWIRHTNPQLFESALQSGNFWIRYESGIVSAKSGYFFYPVTWKDRAQVPVVQKVDNAIYRINHYPLDRAIGFPNTYPWDSDLSFG